MKQMLAILTAAAGAFAAQAAGDFATLLKYDDIPAHVTMTFTGSEGKVSVTGAVEGATLDTYSLGGKGWKIVATADPGYETPTFDTCWYDDQNGDYLTEAQSHVGTATRTNYNIHVYNIATVAKPTYTIRFHANGGSGAMEPMTLYFDEIKDLPPNAFTREHYEFGNWKWTSRLKGTSDYCSGGASVSRLSDATGDVVDFYVQWEPKKYTITFDTDGGSSVTPIEKGYGENRPARSNPSRDGYEFVAWSPALPAKMPPTNMTVKAIWKVKPKITFNSAGGTEVDSISQAYGTTVTPPTPPTRDDGYVFDRWDPALPATMPAVSMTVTAQWVPDVTVVTFTVTDGSFTSSVDDIKANASVQEAVLAGKTMTVTYSTCQQFGVLPDVQNDVPEKGFKRWCIVQDGALVPITTSTKVSANMASAVAQWGRGAIADALDVADFDVTATTEASSGWTPVADSTATGGQSAKVHVETSDYVAGWRYVTLAATLKGPGTLSFRWRINSPGITFGAGSLSEKLAGAEEQLVFTRNSEPYRSLADNSTGWVSFCKGAAEEYTGGDGSLGWQQCSVTNDDVAADVSKTYRWSFKYKGPTAPVPPGEAWIDDIQWTGEGAKSFTVTFNKNGGDGTMASASVSEVGKVLPPNAFTLEGNDFVAWNTQPDGSGLSVTNSAVLAAQSDLTLYAQWAPKKYTLKLGNTDLDDIVLEAGAQVVLPVTAPTREGYVFKEWSPAVPETMPAGGFEVTAVWVPELHWISFDTVDGSEMPPIMQGYGSAVTVAEPTREGYTFAGWTPELPATMSTNDSWVTAQWTVNSYTIAFDSAGGSSVASVTQAYDTKVTPPAEPTRAGYTFEGWTPELPLWMPASNVTATATWKKTDDSENPSKPTKLEQQLYVNVTSEPVEGAATYDGCLYAADGRLTGMIQVKRAKFDAKKGLAKVTATVMLAGSKKMSYSGGTWRADSDVVTLTSSKDGRALKVVLGSRGLTGTYGDYVADGAVNPYTSKDQETKADGAAAMSVVKSIGGAFVLAVPSEGGWGGITVAVKAKGKVSVKGMLADGRKVNVSSQLLVGETSCCIPVVSAKFAEPAFVIWMSRDGTQMKVSGLEGAELSGVGARLLDGAQFEVDATALAATLGGSLLTDYLPNGFSVTSAGSKWLVANGAKPGKVTVDKTTGDLTTTSDNWAALKLNYKSKTGEFKGTFKAYTRDGEKLKATTVKVSGVLVDGVGYGLAAVKKDTAAVTVAPKK